MFNIYTLDKGRLVKIQPDEIAARKPIWVDAIAPDEQERKWVADTFSITLPQPEHLRDIEASARFYDENDELHLRSDFLLGKESDSRSVIVAFVLANNILFSVHDEDLPVFQRFRLRSHVQPDLVADCHDVLIDLYGSDVEFSADALEETYADLGGTSGTVLNNTLSDKEAAMVLATIAH
ncbi:MAG: magnesium transporter CorA, partial [Gallionella sp.]|nr:magnesium transporter CorA [Gallionella sp.]